MKRIEERYRARTKRSGELAEAARAVMPGGDTRAAAWHLPYPLTLERGAGPYVHDVDGNRYLDLLGNYSSLVHGHAYPPIVAAARQQLERGTAWAARSESAILLARLLVERVASAERVRFTNSGTEAALLALAIARAATGRRRILMARYGYHGSHEDTEVGLAGHEGPNTLLGEFGDAASFERVLAERGDEIACVVLEPVLGSAGVVPPPPGFLERVERSARAAGALFVLDEVICFRLAVGGAQSLYGVRPDLTMFGKLIGGGFPVGAVGGRADLLALTDPQGGRLFVSGTFNGNPMTTAAGAVAVQELDLGRIAAMDARAARLAEGLVRAAARLGLPCSVRRAGSILNVFFSEAPPPATLVRADRELAAAFHLAALCRGLFLAPRGMIALSTVVGDEQVDEALAAAEAALADVVAARVGRTR